MPFLRPGKPLAKTGAEIGDNQNPALLSVDFFCPGKNKRSVTERAKDALHSSQSDGGLYGTDQEKNMFYTYILRSISHPLIGNSS